MLVRGEVLQPLFEARGMEMLRTETLLLGLRNSTLTLEVITPVVGKDCSPCAWALGGAAVSLPLAWGLQISSEYYEPL